MQCDLCPIQVAPPQGCPKDAEYIFDMHLVNWIPKDSARVASDDGDVYKIVIAEADSWETPRPPFEVGHSVKLQGLCIFRRMNRNHPVIQAAWQVV